MRRRRSRRVFKRAFRHLKKKKRWSKKRFLSMKLSKGKRRRNYRIARGGIML